MSLFLLLNPKQYTTTPIVEDKSDVWYKHDRRKRRREEREEAIAVELLTEQMEAYARSAEYKTDELKTALSKLHKKGYHRIEKYHRQLIDELLLLILLNDDD
jgi:hypothetical protein